MSTSIGDLLTLAAQQLREHRSDLEDAEAAIATFAHTARILSRLADCEDVAHDGTLTVHGRQAARLAQACDQAAAAWPTHDSRAAGLTGAAADLASQLLPQLGPAQRWALTTAFARTARAAAVTARSFDPYRDVPELRTVEHAAAAAVQQAAADPPTLVGRTALEHVVAAAAPPSLDGVAAAAEAAVALTSATHAAAARGAITLLEMLAASTAAENAAGYATALAQAIHPSAAAPLPWASAPAGWRAVILACAPFDDGTKTRPTPSPMRGLARHLDATLRASLGPLEQSSPDRLRHRPDLPTVATHLRTIANHLPDLATQLHRGASRWIEQRRLVAPERSLPSYEQRNQTAQRTAGSRVVFLDPIDLKPLLTALDDTARLAAALSGHLHTTRRVGRQLQPNLAAARAADATDPTEQTLLQRSAGRATLRAGATAVTSWAFPPPLRRPGPAR